MTPPLLSCTRRALIVGTCQGIRGPGSPRAMPGNRKRKTEEGDTTMGGRNSPCEYYEWRGCKAAWIIE
ncbi:hypothetical protein PISMIDRAFT_506413 [Pisolithus microcarpus 441]|uniref:Uncharacterized protein n=1 Tax=Pisolithus microcarpus 441 TaxID=765257 RepID=A0A0C9YC89_9AGAM|nr:hypothetical protein PISMIDRAFT_506413 [Pisolithus microcarpus 441]